MIILVSKTFFKIFTNNFAKAIALYPFVIVKSKELQQDAIILNHERIHLRQQLELLILPFYIWYIIEFAIMLIKYKSFRKAYQNISFEKEAFENDRDMSYLKNRKTWAFLRFN